MRKLLLLNLTTVETCKAQDVLSRDWDIHLARDASQAKALCAEHGFRVGLVLVMPSEIDRIYEHVKSVVCTARSVEWIALLPRQCLEDTRIFALLAEHFYDYHALPIDPQRLLFALGHAYGMAGLAEQLATLKITDKGRFGMIGGSPAMQQLFRNIERAAKVGVPVLITGESGTGKELAARAIHEHSARAQGPFVAVNCAALPADLIQSELLGYEKGAFTGADQRKIGLIESADGGTLFLDEIGDLPPRLQVNLLRFLQEKTIERIGGVRSIHVDVRVIAATNVDLERAVHEQQFRHDLFYRLNVLCLRKPSLRERGTDVELLANYFFHELSPKVNRLIKGFSQEALGVMAGYNWPGNVRELRNRVQRALVLGEGRYITPTDLGLERRSPRRALATLEEVRDAAEKEVIVAALLRNRRNVSHTARDLHVSRVTLYRLMEKHQIGALIDDSRRLSCLPDTERRGT